MNKNTINRELNFAYDVLREEAIANEKGQIEKSFRGQISSFGAAVTMGSLLPAIAFFEKRGSAKVDRERLTKAILNVLKKSGKAEENVGSLFEYAQNEIQKGRADICKEEIVNAAIALKLSMNLYELID